MVFSGLGNQGRGIRNESNDRTHSTFRNQKYRQYPQCIYGILPTYGRCQCHTGFDPQVPSHAPHALLWRQKSKRGRSEGEKANIHQRTLQPAGRELDNLVKMVQRGFWSSQSTSEGRRCLCLNKCRASLTDSR